MNTNQELPSHIGGYQHLEPDVICKEGDIYVEDGKPMGPCVSLIGETVGTAERNMGQRIYRKMPVTKQGDNDDTGWKKIRAEAGAADFKKACAALPTEAKARKATPIASGFLDYFPLAVAEIARVSQAGNDQHHPGTPLHWDRSKSADEADALIRHFMERGTIDSDGIRHSAKMAWRAMALLQKELENLIEITPP